MTNLKQLESDLNTTSKKLYGKGSDLERSLLQTACREHPGEDPDTLLSFKLYPTKLAIILSNGQKHEYSLLDLLSLMRSLIMRDQPEKTTGSGDPPT